MQDKVKMKRTLGFWATYGAIFGCMISGTAMVSLGNAAGSAGSGIWLPALIAMCILLCIGCAYGELVSMIPGGGMINDYTAPALGKFFALFAVLSGYVLMIAVDGGTQIIIAGTSIEELTGIPQMLATLCILGIAVLIHMTGIQIYGKAEGITSAIMIVIFLGVGLVGFSGMGISEQVNVIRPLQPENGWVSSLALVGPIFWWYVGFEFICPTAEENKRPHRNIAWSLLLGVVTITVFDLIFSYAAIRYVSLDELTSSSIPHVLVANAVLGGFGKLCMTIITIFAAFTSVMAELATLPRLLYGLAHKDLAPKIFTYLHPKFKTPWAGIIFTTALMSLSLIYMQFNGTDADIIMLLVQIASATWMLSYIIALIDVLVYRKRYPNYPRLTKYPFMPVIMVLGLCGLLYALWTLRDVWGISLLAVGVMAVYCFAWLKYKKLPLFQPESLEDCVKGLMERAEPYPEWDEAVTKWLEEVRYQYGNS